MGVFEEIVTEHPLRERFHAQRMLALYRCGRQAEALEAYRHARAVLVGEVGIEPGSELRDLHERILNQDPELDPPAAEVERRADRATIATTAAPVPSAVVPAVRYLLLGPVATLVDGRAVELGGPRQRGVLVVLLTQAGRLVPASRVIDAVWGDEAPASAVNLVQRSVSQLRKAIGQHAIETRGPGYLVRVEPEALDLHVFERLARAGSVALHDGRFEEAAGVLREALALWRGAALADLADQPFLQYESARLEEMRLLALERALEADLECGRHADALAEAEALVHDHPLRERPRELVMRGALPLRSAGRGARGLSPHP